MSNNEFLKKRKIRKNTEQNEIKMIKWSHIVKLFMNLAFCL